MNREYAYNRDKGKCKCCGKPFSITVPKHCHHIDNQLPIERINKVPNLAWLCESCHRIQKEGYSQSNPTVAKTDKNPPSRQNSEPVDMQTDKGTVSDRQRKPSVKAKLDRYKAQSKQQKEAERKEPEVSKPEVKNAPAQTVHQQPKPKSKNVKER